MKYNSYIVQQIIIHLMHFNWKLYNTSKNISLTTCTFNFLDFSRLSRWMATLCVFIWEVDKPFHCGLHETS